jgi:hypothetical protein
METPMTPRLAIAFIATLLGMPATAETCADPASVAAAMENLSGYQDVLSDIACDAPALPAHRLLCENDALWQIGLLDTRARVYAYENATGTETDHTNPPRDEDFTARRDACMDAACLCAALISHTNDSLGGLSPYQQ